MIKLMLIVLFFWCYRQIGVLRYRIRGVSTRHDSNNVHFPSVPNLGVYLFWKYVSKRFFVWEPEGRVYFYSIEGSRKHLWGDYKRIYLWPMEVFKKIHSDYKYGIYRSRRSADRRWRSYLEKEEI